MGSLTGTLRDDTDGTLYNVTIAPATTATEPPPDPEPDPEPEQPAPDPVVTVSLFSDADKPSVMSDADAVQVNLGVRFTPSAAGKITGVRYYKGPDDEGQHTGSLWKSDGTLLGTVTFANETESGWQTAKFATPIDVEAGASYVAGYRSNGHYTSTANYFTKDKVNGPLTAPAANNGVYAYGTGNPFPNQSFGGANYWVDVLLETSAQTAPVAPTPEPPPPATTDPAPSGEVTHGRQITPQNTGHTAYFDAGLGRKVLDSDLTVHNDVVWISDLVSAGGTLTRHWFKAGLVFDRHDVTLRACRVEGGVSGYNSGTHYRFKLEYVTIDTAGAADDDGINFQDYTAYRCRIGGCSDGAKINGNAKLTECYIRCKGQGAGDHNDGLQAVGSYTGCEVKRCNIDCRPTNGIGAPNAALFAADGSNGLMVWHDNWVAGGGYVIRCYENCTYDVQGNDVLDGSWGYGPVARAIIPASNLVWANNRVVASDGSKVSDISKP